ncbi:helix-turn-helix domain-containing protein [Actinacidiphila acidipaludis]|uniref:Helix-turn-helix transcriptional regulator n=1 Tax=Actinacidiphila acidipaludis TaxID=2873382 RepID=A0ABS7QGM0_9ACTN|nr:helix-turn-helix transcriptional regulator [Streptomyces acidipaludis]MBY8882321.1 helix-turn-helix transcriptional regulator [Streptomyces acidipaludis]
MDSIARDVKFSEILLSLLTSSSPTVTRKKLASQIGVSEGTVSHYVNGRVRPSFETLLRIADFFNVSLDYLVHGERAPSAVLAEDTLGLRAEMMRAMAESLEHSGRQRDLIVRVNQRLHQQVERVAREIVGAPENTGPVGMISEPEAMAIEGCATRVQVMARQAPADLTVAPDGTTEPGPFFGTMTDNVRRGVTYQYLFYGKRTGFVPYATRLRELLRSQDIRSDTLAENLAFRNVDADLITGVCVYTVDTAMLERREPILWERFRDDGLFGDTFVYISIRHKDAPGGVVLDAAHAEACQRILTRDWRQAGTL